MVLRGRHKEVKTPRQNTKAKQSRNKAGSTQQAKEQHTPLQAPELMFHFVRCKQQCKPRVRAPAELAHPAHSKNHPYQPSSNKAQQQLSAKELWRNVAALMPNSCCAGTPQKGLLGKSSTEKKLLGKSSTEKELLERNSTEKGRFEAAPRKRGSGKELHGIKGLWRGATRKRGSGEEQSE